MKKNALEEMEAGGVVISNKYGSRRFWGITLLCSIAAMAVSLLIFCLTGKANNMEGSTANTVISVGMFIILQFVLNGAMQMWCGHDPSPPALSLQEIDPAEIAGLEQAGVVLICIVTLWLGKTVEVFIYTMSFVTGLVAISQLASPSFGMKHLWLIIGIGTITGLICLVSYLFFFFGWFSIFILTYVFIVRFNFPDKTLVEVFAMVSEILT